jgi:hypothetical protein
MGPVSVVQSWRPYLGNFEKIAKKCPKKLSFFGQEYGRFKIGRMVLLSFAM